jgi:predicted nucleic acid-binding protein
VALTHLVDTSVLTRLRRPEVREIITPLASAGQLGRTTMSDLEIGYSAGNTDEWDLLTEALEAFDLVEIHARHFDRARQVQRALASTGQRGRKIPDLLIAAAAEEQRLDLLHYDNDFDLIAAVTGQAVEWVVLAGTID